MSIIYFLEVHSTHDDNMALSSSLLDELKLSLRTLPNLIELLMFTPEEGGDDPFLKDKHPPLLVVQAMFNEINLLEKTLNSAEFQKLQNQISALPIKNLRLIQEAMQMESFLASETKNGLADLSYLVSYQGPAENETEFLQYYRDHHPQILMHFPDVRRVELGLPVKWTPAADIEHANRLLYCEVSFDSMSLLNTALNSPMRAELRKDFECFPPFSGAVTHFPMHRQSIL
jgi:hypothetical protein